MTIGQVLFKFSGRIGRQEFWLKGYIPQLIYSVVLIPVSIGASLEAMSTSSGSELLPKLLLFYLLYIPALWVALAVAIKRFHDRDKSGWWILLVLVPVIGLLWIFIENGFLKGTDGSNRFGADPLA